MKGNSNEQTWLWQTERLGEDFPLGSRGGIAARHYFPVDGDYDLRVRLARTYADVIRGLQVPSDIEIRVDGVRVGRFTIGGPRLHRGEPGRRRTAARARAAEGGPRARWWRPSSRPSGVKAEGLGPDRIPIWNRDSDVPTFPLFISSLLIGGPYNGRVPDGLAQPPAHLHVPAREPATTRAACATTILSTLARRAYRRPATPADVADAAELLRRRPGGRRLRRRRPRGARAPARQPGLPVPHRGRSRGRSRRGAAYRLSDVELASRLSFFLWSSIPDDELLDAGRRGTRCGSPAVLERQVRRMLADPRARAALVDNFFGQWLQTRNVWLLTPDTNTKFPWFDDNLRAAFVRETELFLDDQLKADRSVVDLLAADYTFLNEQLAGHYGIRGVYGSHFRRVPLADENRWGLLGKASVLAVTSYPTRTSPTIRGKWLLDNILAAPVPPPPPGREHQPGGRHGRHARLGARDARAASRQPDVRQLPCAHGSARLQPGELRRARPVADRRRRVADRRHRACCWTAPAVDGPAALRRALVAQKEQFVRTVTGKLLTYAVGPRDGVLRRAGRSAASCAPPRPTTIAGRRTILAIVKSTPFQMRRSRS